MISACAHLRSALLASLQRLFGIVSAFAIGPLAAATTETFKADR